VTLGLALLAGGITAVIMLLAGALTLANLPVLLGVTLAVIGAGLVLGAFVRSGRGLIPVALLLGVLTWASVAAPLDRWQGNGIGELRAAPTTVAALQPSYQRTAGEIALDLRNLDLSVPPGGNASPVRSAITLGVGDVEVWVPPNADLTLTSTTGVGDVEFDGRSESGPGAHLAVTDDLGADGVPTGRPLVMTIETGAGSVEVHRG
jgi:predicted membrane protein